MSAESAAVEREVRRGGLGEYPLEGRVAVVTGGSSGIGAATARRLAGYGARIVVGYNSGLERAESVVQGLPGDGHSAVRMPIEDTPALERARHEIEERYGRVDVLVNSAGATQKIAHADLAAMDDELFDSMMRLNVRGPFAVTRTFAPLLVASGDGVVVNVSSLSGTTALGSNVGYCAAKAALDNLTMSTARVLAPEVRVLGVAPAAVETDFVQGRSLDAIVAQASGTPLKVVVHPDDVAECIAGAVTHLRIATGTTLVVDGGKHL
ncbi:SDR family NAD(P)-dependent oxidoreductase [Modestobacter sp. VKM Ac-2978]|uniref:SDR family NAD(P)-dependent oxidoreductase n=1 Tax=Modestobacter sp. VKM Ac-2978 TaxID=3004132 RepID=UPI0022AABC7B|nr:SDR family oxidoreductase [Modestobacter sp. VKM Ac-2978]MCZ2849900.1 SDR family NAD(P)-dependent oxidoreductase [Modestobacter sp. VKM Ac-2978]